MISKRKAITASNALVVVGIVLIIAMASFLAFHYAFESTYPPVTTTTATNGVYLAAPSSGYIGEVENFSAGGLPANTQEEMVLASSNPDVFVRNFTTGASGTFSGTFTVPSAALGSYNLHIESEVVNLAYSVIVAPSTSSTTSSLATSSSSISQTTTSQQTILTNPMLLTEYSLAAVIVILFATIIFIAVRRR